MKTLTRIAALGVSALTCLAVAAAPASAVTNGSWTVDQVHYNIYSDGGYANTLFSKPPTSLPAAAKITKTSYRVSPYNNGNTADAVRLCYRQLYSGYDFRCEDIAVTGNATLSTSDFNGLDARGTFVITHTLYGGTYIAYGGTAKDTVTVDYAF